MPRDGSGAWGNDTKSGGSMKLSKILEWSGLLFAGAVLLFAGFGLIVLGRIGLSYLRPILNTVLSDGSMVTWQHIALYWVMLFGGLFLFILSFAISLSLVITNLPN